MEPRPPVAARPSAMTALLRGAVKHCPRCGRGGLFSGWFRLADRCPRCGLPFERGEGYWLGAIAINLGVTELVFGAAFVLGIVATWPDVPWVPLGVASVALNALVPVVFYPFSKTIFLALDLILLHPDRWEAPASEVDPRALSTDGSPATSPTPNPRPDAL